MTTKHTTHEDASVAQDLSTMILDGHKLPWHQDKVDAWKRGERIAPITIDMALTRKCDYACGFCYAALQENEGGVITTEHMEAFLEDCKDIGVRGVSLVSDGESLLSPAYVRSIQYGAELGLSMASGTNGRTFTPEKLEAVLPSLTYLRFNFSAGEPQRYSEIMGTKEASFERVCENVRYATERKRSDSLDVTIGLQMVLMPQDADQIIPLAKLGKELGVDYVVIKHCSDDEEGTLGVDYEKYEALHPLLERAESYSTDTYKVVPKWSKIRDEGKRSYEHCYGAPFLLQISGSGLVAPCGMMFNDKYAKFHIGNITETRFKDIWESERYWDVMGYLGSDDFNAKFMCGTLCLQHKVNEALDNMVTHGQPIPAPEGPEPMHRNFV